MKFGFTIFPLLSHPHSMVDVVKRAEDLGFESVFTPDHLVFPMEVPATYPYAPDGRSPILFQEGEGPRFDAWSLLSHFAAVTSKIKLGTNVYLIPLRDPLVVARGIMTLDVLSKGRTLIGAGVGWLEEEFQIAGRSFKTRGAVMDESIAVLRQLWTQKVIEYRGKHLSYGPFMFEPKPPQQPPPIFIGGTTEPALRRAARLGDGWMSTGADFETTKGRIAHLRALLKENGRENAPFSITVGGGQVDLDDVRRYEEAGVDRILATPGSMRERTTPESFAAGLDRLAETLVARA